MLQNAAKSCYLAVDIGATKAAIAIVGENLSILEKVEVATGNNEKIWDAIEVATKELINNQKVEIKAIGIGSAGPIDLNNGSISPVNISSWRGFPIVENFKNLLAVQKIQLCGDAVALAIAESKVGAGKEVPSFLGMVVSTGVGGGLILNGKVHHGESGNAGYFGHHSISFAGETCACGRAGCLELYASGPMIVKDAIAHGWNGSIMDFKTLATDARSGDEIALQSIERGAKALAVGIVNVLDILDINTVIVGGGVSKAGAIYWDLLEKHVQSEAKYAGFLQKVDLRPSQLSSDAGLIGAAILAMQD